MWWDLIILDLGLPGMDGLEVVRQVRGQGSSTPIIILSSRDDEAGKVAARTWAPTIMSANRLGSRNGAHPRCHAPRLQQEGEKPLFHSGDLTVDLVRRIAAVRGQEVKLTPREYDLLRLLASHAGKVLTHKFILKEVWGGKAMCSICASYIRTLRQKLEADPEQPGLILTEQGVGYRLRASN